MSYYKPYPVYKNSGIDWVGRIPETWQITRLKYVSELNPKKSSMEVEREESCTFLPMENLKTDSVVLDETRVIEEVYDGYSYFGNGDILIAKVTPCFENKNIAIADDLVNGIGFGSTEINTIRSNEQSYNRFLYYRLQEEQFRKIAINAMTGTGGLKRVPSEIFQTFKIAIPSYDEQKRIAEQIDKETTRIDTLIAKKTRFIELLKEKRQALITHLVTKGLNPDVPMKDSGIEWIGEVPEHWLNRKVFHAFETIGSGTTPPSKEPEWYEGGTIPWITTSELRENEIFETKKCVTLEALEKFSTLKIYPANSLAIAMYGATIGRLGFLGVPATTNQACCVLSGERDLNLRFVYFWLIAFKDTVIESFSEGGGQPNINQDVVANLWIPSPSLKEQQSIVENINYESERIDLLISKTQNSIELLIESRSAFITAAVTGQINLREVVS